MTDFLICASSSAARDHLWCYMHLYAREAGGLRRVGNPLLLVDCEEPPLFCQLIRNPALSLAILDGSSVYCLPVKSSFSKLTLCQC